MERGNWRALSYMPLTLMSLMIRYLKYDYINSLIIINLKLNILASFSFQRMGRITFGGPKSTVRISSA
jgi:hypothetical protein